MTSLVNRVQNLSSQMRLVWAIGLAVCVFLMLPSNLQISTRLLAAWGAGAGAFLLLAMLMMQKATAAVTRDRSQRCYGAHPVTMMFLPIGVACISLFAITFLLSTVKNAPALVLMGHIGLAVFAILCSWFLIPITFARRYATIYYRQPKANSETDWNTELNWAGGLTFAEEAAPTYWDFLYFAFILTATAQTADTMIASRPMRRLALVQCLIAFFFFVVVFAMLVNIGSSVIAAAYN